MEQKESLFKRILQKDAHRKVDSQTQNRDAGKGAIEEGKRLKSLREAKFRTYLNSHDNTLDNLTRALADLLRSNEEPDSPADWLIYRLSKKNDDDGNTLREVQERLNEQVKENEKLRDELREVVEDANEMADLIREYERREEERLAIKSAKKELTRDRSKILGRPQSPSSSSLSDASSLGLPRFNEIQEKIWRQHSIKKPPSPPASDIPPSNYYDQFVNDRLRKVAYRQKYRFLKQLRENQHRFF